MYVMALVDVIVGYSTYHSLLLLQLKATLAALTGVQAGQQVLFGDRINIASDQVEQLVCCGIAESADSHVDIILAKPVVDGCDIWHVASVGRG